MFPKVDDVQIALDFLEMEGYVRRDKTPAPTGGRPASPLYIVTSNGGRQFVVAGSPG
jgi:hypothetical protein